MEKPAQIGDYQVEEELSQSSTATVYRAFEPALGRRVLIKKLHPQMTHDAEIRTRFEREAQLCAQLEHTNIVRVFGYRSDPELTMLVMEYVEGESLRAVISRLGRVEWRTALVILNQLLKGLASAHSKGILHRDIKPDNILISRQGEAKLTDFGLATLEDAPRLTRQGAVVGTPAYMPPEQISGEPADRRSDLFSLGATLYETLTGVSPFKADTFSETMHLILTAELQRPSAIIPDIPPEFDHLILRLLDKRPARRFGSAEQTLDELRRIASQYLVPLDPEPVAGLIAEAGISPAVRGEATTSAILKKKPKTLAYIAVAAAIAVIAAVMVTQNLKSSRESFSPVQTPIVQTRDSIPPSAESKTSVKTPSTADTVASLANLISKSPSLETVAPQVVNLVDSRPLLGEAFTDTTPSISGSGWFSITCEQWASITIDHTSYGVTPTLSPIELSTGEHQIVLTNDQFPSPVVETVIVKLKDSQRLHIDLLDYFGVLRVLAVNPWAEIFVDGESQGQTPLAKPIILSFGEHVIELRNPDFPTWRKMVNFTSTDRTLELTVDLTKISDEVGQNR